MRSGRARSVSALLVTTALVGAMVGQAAGAAKKPTRPAASPVAFATYPMPAGFDADNAGEPSVGINWNTGNVLFQAGTGTWRATFNDAARPPSVTWKDVSSPYTPINVDPILATDAISGRTLAGGDGGACGSLALTLNDGDTWTPSLPCTGIIDHPTVGFGPVRPETGNIGGSDRVAYYCQQYPLANECARSLDGGQTWSTAVPVQYCIGLFGHVKTSKDGIAYLPSKGCYARGTYGANPYGVGGAVSLDNGLTWTSYSIPGGEKSSGFDPSVGVASDGTVYEAWTDSGFNLLLAKSSDHAASWSTPIDVSAAVSPALAATTFPSVVAGDRDRVAVAYLGSTVPVGGSDPFGDYHGVWNLYVSISYNAGSTWTTQKISADPVQRGWIDNGGVGASDHRNLLDFMDAGLTKTGRIVIGYADGCVRACADSDGTEASSKSQYGTVSRQWSGKGLFAAYDKTNK